MSDRAQDLPAGDDLLTQAEIDRMLAETAAAAAPEASRAPVFRHTGERFAPAETPMVEPHDFSSPMVIDEIVMRALRQRHEEFAVLLSARLSIFLRMDFTLKLQRISTVAYRRFTSTVATPGHVVLFKVEPLTGVGVIDMSPQLGLSLVDRMLGGKGQVDGVADALTEIEMNLLDDVVNVMLEEWCRLWGNDRRFSPAIIGRESGGRYLQTSASDTAMLVGIFEGSLGECAERIQIAMPFPSVEGNVRTMVALLPSAVTGGGPARRSSWSSAYNAIPLPLSIEWDARDMTVREILALAPGSVLRLPREIIRNTRVRLSGVTKFTGEIGREGDQLAVRIDDQLSPEDV